jgi:hypothetical protein
LSVILLFLWNNVISPLLNHQSPKI